MGLWIGNRIYWTFKTHNYKEPLRTPCSALHRWHTRYSVCYSFTSLCLVAAFNSGRSHSSGFPNWSGLSYQLLTEQLNPTGYLSKCNTFPVLLATSRHGTHREHRSSVRVKLLRSCRSACPSDLYSASSWHRPMSEEPSRSNGFCIVAYFAVII
jgi:hypothetical protein